MSIFTAVGYRAAIVFQGLISRDFRRAVALLQKGEGMTREQLEEMRNRAFIDLVHHCYQYVPYYKRLMDQYSIKPENVQSLDDIHHFPVMTKESIRSARNDLRATNLRWSCLERHSGGTTGEPFVWYIDPYARVVETYAYFRGLQWMGWRPGMGIINLWGGSLGRPAKLPLRSYLRELAMGDVSLSAFDLSRDNALAYFETIKRAGPSVLIGYPSAILLLANYAEELSIRDLPLVAVFPTAEQVPEIWSNRMARIFSCPVKSYYGSAEINSVGFQVQQEGPYWIADEHVYVEKLGDQDGQGIDEPGDLLFTSLYNYTYPLIRYAVGDMGTVASPGELHPTRSCLRMFAGRSADTFMREDGTHVPAIMANKAVTATGLPFKRYQFVQWELNKVELRYELMEDIPSSEQVNELITILRSYIGANLQVDLKQTSDFILTPARKHRTMISRLPRGSRLEE
jgi:phenylacetate-CoA ligase